MRRKFAGIIITKGTEVISKQNKIRHLTCSADMLHKGHSQKPISRPETAYKCVFVVGEKTQIKNRKG